ncbi:MAG: hypothetical protein LBR38_10110 [Synergistaceae bacterium]|jgi:hypothetical protein|nr:hypothetical protein [Synergistaceae bacterium]
MFERRVAFIVRWLERCLKSCGSGSLESALMDVECASADMELLRRALWEKVGRRSGSRWHSAGMAVKTALVAALLVMATAEPLARPMYADVLSSQPQEAFSSQPQPEPQLVSTPAAPVKSAARGRREAPAKTKPETKAEEIKNAAPKAADFLPYDRVLSLVRTGERALKNEPPIIIVGPENRGEMSR